MKKLLVIVFQVLLVSCATYKANKPNNYIYWVNSAKVPYKGVGEMQCLKVQKGEKMIEGNWEYFYSSIDGFDYQPGFIYKLIVNEEAIKKENVPSDGSSIKYTLVKILEKKKDARLWINDIWVMEAINGEAILQNKTNSRNRIPQIEFNVAEMKVHGNDGCNNFFGSINKLTAKEIVFGPIAGTKMACVGTDIPDKFNTALNKVTTYKIEEMQLFLLDNSGNKQLTFKKID